MTPAALKVVHVVGARPNLMKIAPLLRELESRNGADDARPCRFDNLLVHTGQHYDAAMSGDFFEDLGIRPPDVNLGVGSGAHGAQTAAVMTSFEPLLQREEPDLVVVVGDVNSTMAATLTAAKLHVPVAHVEAGLRSRDRRMPEEINRLVTDQIADLLLTTSAGAGDNLRAEGIPDDRIHFVGNTMIDTLQTFLPKARDRAVWADYGLEAGAYALVTLHRPSNVDDPAQLGEILDALSEIAREVPVLFPVHPRTRARLEEHGLTARGVGGVQMVDPLGYVELLSLQSSAKVVLTDSGGIQEETTVLGVPCLTLRDSTERPVTVTMGTNRLIPLRTKANITAAFRDSASTPVVGRVPPLWDGHAARRIADVFEAWTSSRRSPPGVQQAREARVE